jgi:hypothetical protein
MGAGATVDSTECLMQHPGAMCCTRCAASEALLTAKGFCAASRRAGTAARPGRSNARAPDAWARCPPRRPTLAALRRRR